ncbi:hypothetical protein [uncultured Roseibium sp.]|uniref:hypothetical protein n=1 Tax=uncultured Roseibium sp. TaxID=1936171 RepID=UPI0026220606|nr:hypothetical protein [uncultured Roseibium sp.]
MAEIAVLMADFLLFDLQKGEPAGEQARELATQSKTYNAHSNFSLATPNSDTGNSYFVSFFVDERAGEFAEKIREIDGVLSVIVKPELGLP